MKNILVPTDFSENCNKASQLAIEIATIFKAEIHFLHQINTPVEWVKLSKWKEKRYPDTIKKIGLANTELKKLELEAEKRNLTHRTFIEYVLDEENIVKHSGHFHHDFVVTGSKETHGGFLNKLFESNVLNIIKNIEVPIIVVKNDSVTFPFRNIVFVSDFSEDVNDAFNEVLLIVEKCGAHIHFLNINTNSGFNSVENGLEPIRAFVKQFPKLQKYSMHVYNESTVIKGITKFNETISTDLIAICTHSKKGFLSMFSRSIAEEVTHHSNLPVMTIHL